MKKLFVFLLSFLTTLSFIPAGGLNVKAVSPDIYYFSDSPNRQIVFNALLADTSLTNNDICLVNVDDYRYYLDGIIYNYYDNYYNLEDKIIIFEMSRGFALEPDYHNGNTLPEKLELLFSTWKDNNCTIMFIGGTDETRYLQNNDFLDYVDFHIILDVRHVFMMNVFYYLEQLFGSTPQNFDLLFDSLFVENAFGLPYGNRILKRDYIIPYIRSRYRSDIENNYTNAEAIIRNGANIYLPSGGLSSYYDFTFYYNIVENPFINSCDLYNFSFYNSDPFVVSSSGNDTYGNQYDYEILLGYYDLLNVYSLFFYDIHGVNAQNYIYSGANVYRCSPYVYTYKLVEMITSFIFDDYSVWSAYDNWAGRCDVTHLMTLTGGTGWMHNFTGDSGDFVNCWSVIIPVEEDYDLYYDDGTLY